MKTVLELKEYEKRSYAAELIPEALGERILRELRGKVEIEFPTAKTGHQWELTAQGWVGSYPLGRDVELRLSPRADVAPKNIFGMLELAYKLVNFPTGTVSARSVDEFYNTWAGILVQRVLDRAKRGLYKAYVDINAELYSVRGRIHVAQALRQPWVVALPCDFQELTTDVEDNRLLAGALWRISTNPLCSEKTLRGASEATRILLGSVSSLQLDPSASVGRLYTKLNEDYEALHALCRLFLENAGPSHEAAPKNAGRQEHRTTPFLVDTATLFERFVYEWLVRHLPSEWKLKRQETYDIGLGLGRNRVFKVDMELRDRESGELLMVMETKSRPADMPSTDDLQQVVAYATRAECQRAVLVYPSLRLSGYEQNFGQVNVRALTFPLDADLDAAGEQLLSNIVSALA